MMVNLKFYELRCNKCGLRFNIPKEYNRNISEICKIKPINIRKFKTHYYIKGHCIEYEEDYINNIIKYYMLTKTKDGKYTSVPSLEFIVEQGNIKIKYSAAYEKLVRSAGTKSAGTKISLDDFAKQHGITDFIQGLYQRYNRLSDSHIIKQGKEIIIFANRKERILGENASGKYITILDRNVITEDGQYCSKYTIEADDFKITPIIANVVQVSDNNTHTYIIKCPNCGKVAVRVIQHLPQI